MSHDTAPERRHNKRLQKELVSRGRECLDKDRTHIRLGHWIGETAGPDELVTFIGTTRELHGSVCTCCPKRGAA